MSQKRQSEINFFLKKLKTSDENNPSPSEGIENVSVLPQESEPAAFSDSCVVDFNSQYDIAFAVEENANLKIRNDPNMLYKYLKETWSPRQNYIFPVSMNKKGHKRIFQIEWLNKHNWLAYSRNREGAFCKACVLFGPKFGGIGGQRLGILKEIPMTKYKDALHDFKIHMEREYHKTAIVRSLEFIKCFEGRQKTIEIQLDDQLNETVKENKKKLIPIIKTIIFCGRHNIPLRGHRDDVNLTNLISNNEFFENELNDQAKNNFNIGIFKELLMFRIDAGDVDLRNHLESAPKNATFVSKTIQNNLIDICGSIITDKLIKEVNECKFFSILCDETSDLSHIEQMSLSIRYVDLKSYLIKENFICFVPVYECTGENLANTIVQKLKEIGLSLEFLRGQGYDGGANMSGKYRGVQARILNLQPKATYTHCASHRLNLTLLKACNVLSIKKLFSTVKEVSNFVRDSPKRVDLFKKKNK